MFSGNEEMLVLFRLRLFNCLSSFIHSGKAEMFVYFKFNTFSSESLHTYEGISFKSDPSSISCYKFSHSPILGGTLLIIVYDRDKISRFLHFSIPSGNP